MKAFNVLLLSSVLAAVASSSAAQVLFNFDETGDHLNSPLISGNKLNFPKSTQQAFSAPNSIRFVDNGPEPYESWTYTLPPGIQTGTVSLWFKADIDAAPAIPNFSWGLSFLIEDANNRSDFGAVEVAKSSAGPFTKYFGSEGTGDRLVAGDRFEGNSFPDRDAPGAETWHEITFNISPTITTVAIDGIVSDEIAAPGSEVSPGVPRSLTFRVVAGSVTNGGFQNYITNPQPASAITTSFRNRIFIDDFTVNQVTPAPLTKSITFENIGGSFDYDSPIVQSVSPEVDIPEQAGFVNKFLVADNGAFTRNGSGSASFDPGTKRLRRLVFDLSDAEPGTISLRFYDALGQAPGPLGYQTLFGGSIIIQDGITPEIWRAVEVWNFTFPASADPTPPTPPATTGYNYFYSRGTSPTAATFGSRYFGNRSVGWHTVDIVLTETSSSIFVDGIQNSNGAGVFPGPGLERNLKLIILADSASQGGGTNFVNVGELKQIYDDSTLVTEDYFYVDNVNLATNPPLLSILDSWSVY